MVISCRPCYSSCFCASASHFATHLYHSSSFHAVSDLMLHLVVTNVWAFQCWGSPRVIQWIQTGHNAQLQIGITMFFQLSWSWLQYCHCHSFVMSVFFHMYVEHVGFSVSILFPLSRTLFCFQFCHLCLSACVSYFSTTESSFCIWQTRCLFRADKWASALPYSWDGGLWVHIPALPCWDEES